MKVLFAMDSLGAGGAEASLAQMLPGFRSRGIRSVVACLHAREEGVQAEVERQGGDVRILTAPNHAARFRQLRSLIEDEEPDLVHTTVFEADILGRLAARNRSRVIGSLVNTSYDPVRLQDPNVKRSRLAAARLLDGWTARHLVHHFHALTHSVKRASVDALGIRPERITVIPRGRDPVRLGMPSAERRQRARAALGVDDKAEVVVNVARQEFQKGLEHLLRATATLSGRSGLVVLQAGRRGSTTAELERGSYALRLGDRFRFLGHREDVPDVLAAADVFVFPSLYEGLGGAVIEAMALGLPIVCSDLPALREVVEPNGNAIVVPAGDAGALAGALATLLDDRDRAAAFGVRSRAIFEERFTLDAVVDRMVDLYRQVADRHGPVRSIR